MKKNRTEKKAKVASHKTNKKTPLNSKVYYGALLTILLITVLAYLPVFHNGFVNWDDDQYILENSLIKSINLKQLFTTNVMGNYHPLTMLVFAIEYKLFGLSATGYHIINLFIHLMNTLLVYRLVLLLCESQGASLIAALLFGLHPMHVESVAWVSELKDLLYALFFFLSLMYYLKYSKENKKIFYFISLFLFVPALLSKAMAASLPFVLILTDYFVGKKFTLKTLVEKVPFFILALLLGIVAIYAQKETGALAEKSVFPLAQKIVFASYGYVNYLLKIIFPFNLSAFYPYPIQSGSSLPSLYYLFPLLAIGLLVYIVYSIRLTKKIVFALGFFTLTIFLVLQLLPVGQAVMADRYSYIPSFGLFYLSAEGIIHLWEKKQRILIYSLLSFVIVIYSVKTYQRCETWKNGMTLWNDVISRYQNVALAYNSRGVLFDNSGNFENALSDYTKAIELNPANDKAYNNRGNLLMKNNQFEKAIADYSKSIELKSDYYGSYKNRANAHTSLGQNDAAFSDYSKAIYLESSDAETYYYRGNLLKSINKNTEALKDYAKAIDLRPDYFEVYYNRAMLYTNENKPEEALQDYKSAIQLQPDNPIAYYNIGNILGSLEKYEEAIQNFSKAINLKNDYALAYFGRGITQCNLGKKEIGCTDLLQAIKMGFQPANEAYKNFCH